MSCSNVIVCEEAQGSPNPLLCNLGQQDVTLSKCVYNMLHHTGVALIVQLRCEWAWLGYIIVAAQSCPIWCGNAQQYNLL